MNRREWEVLARCDSCKDLFSVVFWLTGNNKGYRALLEKSTTTVIKNGELIHRPDHCNGIVRIYDRMPGPTVLQLD